MHFDISSRVLCSLPEALCTLDLCHLTELRNEIDSCENVKVLTLAAPERNQPTIHEAMGAAEA